MPWWVSFKIFNRRSNLVGQTSSFLGKKQSFRLRRSIPIRELGEKIGHTNTHPSYVNLIERKVQLVFAAREPSDEEINLSRQNGVEIKTFPIARDALVFIVNELNRVNTLSIEQIRDVFSGKLLDWADVGGYKATIHPYRRNRNLGTEENMDKLVMKGVPSISHDYASKERTLCSAQDIK